jgi:hypothetical protein
MRNEDGTHIDDAREREWHPGQPGALSEDAPSEVTGPLPVVGSGGVVGGRPSRADLEMLRDGWRIRAGEAASESDYHRLKYEYTTAERHERTRAAYLDCAEQLDRLLASSNERQPTPNNDSAASVAEQK